MIKKVILFNILMAMTAVSFAKAVTIPTTDISGSQDHLLLKRYSGSYIVGYESKGFDEFSIPLSKLMAGVKSGSSFTQYSPDQSKQLEGPYTRLVYIMPEGRSPLEIIRNYQEEILAQEGKSLYECKREECGGFEEWGIKKFSGQTGKPISLAMYLRPYSRLGMEKYSRGYCATTSNIMDQRYLAAEIPKTGTYFSIHTYTVKNRDYYNNCDAFKGRTIAVVDIVEGKPREQNMVTIKASDMAKQIIEAGSVSLYGIFFDTDKSSIQETSEATLAEIAKLTQQQSDIKLLIVGHTDDVGSFEYNMNLSKSRAQAVVDKLSSQYGVSKERLTPVGVSFSNPISSNATEEGRALNRRVALVSNRSK